MTKNSFMENIEFPKTKNKKTRQQMGKRAEWVLHKKITHMANKHRKTCLTSLIIRETVFKTSIWYYNRNGSLVNN